VALEVAGLHEIGQYGLLVDVGVHIGRQMGGYESVDEIWRSDDVAKPKTWK
jgi:hypothetical protein